jgi:hypothetical protein
MDSAPVGKITPAASTMELRADENGRFRAFAAFQMLVIPSSVPFTIMLDSIALACLLNLPVSTRFWNAVAKGFGREQRREWG